MSPSVLTGHSCSIYEYSLPAYLRQHLFQAIYSPVNGIQVPVLQFLCACAGETLTCHCRAYSFWLALELMDQTGEVPVC